MVRLSKISVYLLLLNKTFFKLQYFKNVPIYTEGPTRSKHTHKSLWDCIINRVKLQKSTKSRLNNHLRSSWWGFRTLIKRRRLFIKWSLRKLILALANRTRQPNGFSTFNWGGKFFSRQQAGKGNDPEIIIGKWKDIQNNFYIKRLIRTN